MNARSAAIRNLGLAAAVGGLIGAQAGADGHAPMAAYVVGGIVIGLGAGLALLAGEHALRQEAEGRNPPKVLKWYFASGGWSVLLWIVTIVGTLFAYLTYLTISVS